MLWLGKIYTEYCILQSSATREEKRLCDLVHSAKRCYNTFKENGVQNDLDNRHMLSIIEKKKYASDRNVWSRDLKREKKQATLYALMCWMMHGGDEIALGSNDRSKNRSTNRRSNLQLKDDTGDEEKILHKCWLCRNSTHWPDHCQTLKSTVWILMNEWSLPQLTMSVSDGWRKSEEITT